jgi:SSS family solute:Na+ symporter
MALVLISFIGCTLCVLAFAFYKSRKVSKTTSDGFFLGGRSLTAGVIGAGFLVYNFEEAQDA